jgi:sec-independent protein translocase protein TatB
MFDIGFSELIVIGVVALVVIGPERLPKVARTLGVLFGRMQRYVTQVKSDISREMEMAELGKVKTEFESAARSFQSEVQSGSAQVEQEMRDAQSSIERELSEKAAAAGEPAATTAPETAGPEAPPAAAQLELGIEEPASHQGKASR